MIDYIHFFYKQENVCANDNSNLCIGGISKCDIEKLYNKHLNN